MTSSGRIYPSGEDLAIYSSLIAVQAFCGGMTVMMGDLLSNGAAPSVILAYSGFASTVALAPFAFFLERCKWPARFSFSLVAQIVLLAPGLYGWNNLFFVGMSKTSPPFATAMTNLIPSLIFLIAWCLRLERVDLKCRYSWAKLIGTLVCLTGAMVMTFLQGPAVSDIFTTIDLTGYYFAETGNWETVIGSIYLIMAILVFAFSSILQASIVATFSAPLSLITTVSLVGGIFSIILQLILNAGFDRDRWALPALDIAKISFRGIGVDGVTMSIQAWAMHKRGPVLVVIFSPITTVCSAIFSSIFLGSIFYIGSLVGVLLIFTGLYFVLWGKSEDNYNLYKQVREDQKESEARVIRSKAKQSFIEEGNNLETPFLG